MTKQDTPQTHEKPAAGETERAYLRKQVSLLREVFFPYDLVETVQENMEVMRTRENGASEGGILKLLGPSRSGKTKIIRDYARRFPIVEKGIQGKDGEFSDHMPVVCMRVPDTNAKNLLERLVATLSRRSMEDIKTRGFRRFDLQEDVMKLARDVGLQLLCLEETHDAIESHGDKAAKVTAGVLKDLTNESCFSLVVSGTEAAQRLFDLGGELEGRVVFDHPLVPFQWDNIGERTSFLEILGELDEHLARNVFGKKSGLTGSAIAKPLLLASRGWIGHAATLLESAATKAVDAGAHKVALVHFVQAFGVSPLRRYVPDPFLPSKVPQAPLMTADVPTPCVEGRGRRVVTPCSSADFQRLAVAARPLPGESLPGFLIRIAERARYRRADLLAGRCGLRQPGSAFTDDDLGPLARLVDIDLEHLSEMAYRPVFRRTWHVFGNGVLPREFIDVSRRRFCPRCLSEAPFHRRAWDFALATACHVHRTRLRDRCPKCRRGLGWTHPRIVACRCGQDLRDVAAIEIDDLEAHATEALMELVTRPAPAWLPVALLGCEPAELPWLGMCLGMFMTGWRPQRRIETLVAAGPEAVARVTVAAVGALREWPRPLRIFLNTQRADSSSRPGVYGARKNLGGFYDWLTGLDSGGIKDAVAVAVRGLVAEDPALSRRVHRSRLISSGSDGSLIGLNQAKELLGARSERVREMVARGILPGSGAEGRGVPMLIDASAVAALAQRGTQELDLKAAARKLCVSKARLRLLVARGLIPSTRPTGGASTTWAFDERDLDDMLTKLEGAPEAPYGPGDTVGFEHGVEVMRRSGVGFAEVLQMGLSGALPCRSKDLSANGLKRIGFDAVALRRAAAEMRHDHDRLSVQAAAVRLAMKWDVVRNLVARGILTSTDGTVAAGDVVTFAREHVTGAELACQMATSPRAAAARLAARGVLPIVGSKVDGSRQNIYVRSEAELAMRGAVSNGGKPIGSTSCRARRTP